MIGKIYSNASKVVAWLGTYVDDEGGINESILRILNEAIQEVKTKRGKTVGLKDPRGFWPLLDCLFQNEHWNPIWIVQEYLLARKVEITIGLKYFDGLGLDRLCQAVQYEATKPVVGNMIKRRREKRIIEELGTGSSLEQFYDGKAR